jgi:hypothetical protein
MVEWEWETSDEKKEKKNVTAEWCFVKFFLEINSNFIFLWSNESQKVNGKTLDWINCLNSWRYSSAQRMT